MIRRAFRPSRLFLPALTLLAAAACADGPTGPEPISVSAADLVDAYEATTFIGRDGATEIDVLAAGGSIELMLHADGTTEGTMFVPGGDEDGSDYTADLTGTWTLTDGTTVTFEHAGDTFIRDVEWRPYEDGTLRTENQYARVVLTPQ